MTLLNYQHVLIEESGENLVNLANYGFELEPVYFTDGISDTPDMLLRQSVAERLAVARDKLVPLNFKIWDGWRPREVQHVLYMNFGEAVEAQHPDWTDDQIRELVGTYVAIASDPKCIPNHSTGGSVDLTLVDVCGAELNMGTGFDHFGLEAAALYYEHHEGNNAVRNNRRLLRKFLTAAGFRFDEDEWWHFDFGNQIWAAKFNKPKAIYSEVKKK